MREPFSIHGSCPPDVPHGFFYSSDAGLTGGVAPVAGGRSLATGKAPDWDWISRRQGSLEAAIRFLKARCILVSTRERLAPIRSYAVSGRHGQWLAEDVIALAERIAAKESKQTSKQPKAEGACRGKA
jgi:hypothetical protein